MFCVSNGVIYIVNVHPYSVNVFLLSSPSKNKAPTSVNDLAKNLPQVENSKSSSSRFEMNIGSYFEKMYKINGTKVRNKGK